MQTNDNNSNRNVLTNTAAIRQIETPLSHALQQLDEARAIAQILGESLMTCNTDNRTRVMWDDTASIVTHLARSLAVIHACVSDIHDDILDLPRQRGAA